MMVLCLCMMMPFNVYSAPNEEATTEEATTEEGDSSEEATTEEAEKKDSSSKDNFVFENGYWYYKEKGAVAVGWKKVEGKWYYFDGKGRMQREHKVGLYMLHSDGDAEGIPDSDKFIPEPHGYIYYSLDNVVLNNGHDAAEEVEAWISELYRSDKRIDETEIMDVRGEYDSLPLAEKVRVSNESYLAELELEYGIAYDYEEMDASSTDATENYGSYFEGKTFGFTIDKEKSSIDIKIKFSTNNKGAVVIPKISFFSPQEEQTFDISKESVEQISNPFINADITWTDEYVQIDILNAKEGDWKITTDRICRFTTEDYKGVRSVFTPTKSSEDLGSATDSIEGQTDLEEEDSSIVTLILLVVVIAAFVGLMIGIKHVPMGKDRKTDSEDKKENNKKLSKEEEYELLRKELDDMSDDYSDDAYVANKNAYAVEEKQDKLEFTQEEIKESLEDYQPGVQIPDPEAETDVLVSIDGNDLKASDFMNHDTTAKASAGGDDGAVEWLENEE